MDISINVFEELKSVVSNTDFITTPEQLYNYSRDWTSNEEYIPGAVITPRSAKEVSEIVKICNRTKTKLTIRGGGTGVSKGALSFNKGVILSLEKLDKILQINKIDRIAIVESGVVTQVLRDAVREEGLCFPQNISSSESSFIGGNVAVSSGSPKSLKYGPTKNFVLNLEVVLPDGQIIWTGKNVTKDATGFNLTQLFAGSEGALGIITKVVLRLVPPEEELLIMVPFDNIEKLFDCVHQFFVQGFSASSLEFIDSTGYQLVSKFLDKKIEAKNPVDGVLWIELEGKNKEHLMQEMVEISEFIYNYTPEEIFVAQTSQEIKDLWTMRSKVGMAVVNYSFFRDVDIVVPRSKIYEMYSAIAAQARIHDFEYTALGHIGSGNFHVNIFQSQDCSKEKWYQNSNKGISEIFNKAIQLGGTISGEHGIGKLHLPFLNLAIPGPQLTLMKSIKKIFDKNNILNV